MDAIPTRVLVPRLSARTEENRFGAGSRAARIDVVRPQQTRWNDARHAEPRGRVVVGFSIRVRNHAAGSRACRIHWRASKHVPANLTKTGMS